MKTMQTNRVYHMLIALDRAREAMSRPRIGLDFQRGRVVNAAPIIPPPETGPLKLKKTETHGEWLFLHYEGTEYVVRTKEGSILPKCWVQRARDEAPVFAAQTLGECETWIERRRDALA